MQKKCKKICVCQKIVVILQPLSRNGAPGNFNFWGERRLRLPVYLAERYRYYDLVAEREVP